MLIEIVDKAQGYSYIVDLDDGVSSTFAAKLPLRAPLRVWKEEVYIETPVELTLRGPGTIRVELGRVYYWRPGRALCMFYGVSEPYTSVHPIGRFVGPLNYLAVVEEGDEGEVKPHRPVDELSEVVAAFRRLGYTAATPLNGDVIAVAATKYASGFRIPLIAFVEDYGIHIETEALYKHSHDQASLATTYALKRLVEVSRYVRVDLNEDGYVVATAVIEKLDELPRALNELEALYPVLRERALSPGL